MKIALILLLAFPIFGQYTPSSFCADAGSSDAYACNIQPAILAYVAGQDYSFQANTANVGTATINLNSLGAKTIVKVIGGVATVLVDNDIRSGQVVTLQYDGTNMQMQSTLGNAAVDSGGTTPGYPANQPVSGCGVEYVSGLTFTIGACAYTIGGTQYNSPLAGLTLDTADATNPRIDVIAVDSMGVAIKITGTPAANPAQPTVDYSTQLPLNLVLVPAMATTPSGIVATQIYIDNAEWTCANSSNINCNSTSNPYAGTKDIEATAAVSGNNFTLTKPAAGTVDLSTQNTLTFYIRSKATWPTSNGSGSSGLRTLSLFWLNGATQVGVQVVIRSGSFGFDSSITSSYQQITIPVTQFATGANAVTALKGQISGNGGTSSIGFYVDQVTLQSGNGVISLPATLVNHKGVWNSTASYNPNDLVVSNNIGYVALAGNTNKAVSLTGTWQKIGGEEVHGIGASFDGGGSVLTTAKVAYVTVRFGCTITGYSVWADTGTISFDVWKVASGTAIPTVSNTIISGASYLALSTGTLLVSTSTASLTTTSSSAGDTYGFKINAVSGATLAGVQIRCTII